MRQGERGCISLGYAEPDCKLNRPCGFENGSFGYLATTGEARSGTDPKPVYPTFSSNSRGGKVFSNFGAMSAFKAFRREKHLSYLHFLMVSHCCSSQKPLLVLRQVLAPSERIIFEDNTLGYLNRQTRSKKMGTSVCGGSFSCCRGGHVQTYFNSCSCLEVPSEV